MKINSQGKKVKTDKDGNVIYVIDERKRKITYHIKKAKKGERPGQEQYLSALTLDGFTKMPPGFYQDGRGLTSGAYWLLPRLFDKMSQRPFELHFSSTNESHLEDLKTKIKVHLNYGSFNRFQREFRNIKNRRNKEFVDLIDAFNYKNYPAYFPAPQAGNEKLDALDYKKDQLADLLDHTQNLEQKLSRKDLDALSNFYSKFLRNVRERTTATKRLSIVTTNKTASEQIFLEEVIAKFEKLLEKRTLESEWQEFLEKYMMLFNTGYVDALPKLSVTLHGKYPDFILLDVYNYVDIFEIKTHNTKLLKYDASRNNYYWDVEINKAITQTENYIHYLNRNATAFADEIKTSKAITVRVVRPRGYIIAGHSDQLKNDKMRDDFQLLSRSLKNIDVILYDDLLKNLKNLLARPPQ